MPEPVKKLGINAVLLLVVTGLVLPSFLWVGNQASHVPELKVEISHLSENIYELTSSLRAFKDNGMEVQQALIQTTTVQAWEIANMKEQCKDTQEELDKCRAHRTHLRGFKHQDH